jgi:hypothetical protein
VPVSIYALSDITPLLIGVQSNPERDELGSDLASRLRVLSQPSEGTRFSNDYDGESAAEDLPRALALAVFSNPHLAIGLPIL